MSVCALSPRTGSAQLNIVIVPNATLSANTAALAAFNRAATMWSSRFSDNITITINAGLGNLGGSGVIGSTSSVTLVAGYDTIRTQMIADASGQPNNGIVAALPTAAQYASSVLLPGGKTFDGSIVATKANLKAIGGFGNLDATFGASDASITFNTNFSFDFDNSNGVTAGTMDFQTVAAHEIGHALGFISSVDDFDEGATSTGPTTLDLYRFRTGTTVTSANFATAARSLAPNANDSFMDTTNSWRFSTGRNTGDGNQASHWKADDITGINIGIMDPTLSFGQVTLVSDADLRAFDLIGYDLVPVPEPGSILAVATLGMAAVGAVRRRLRKTTVAA